MAKQFFFGKITRFFETRAVPCSQSFFILSYVNILKKMYFILRHRNSISSPMAAYGPKIIRTPCPWPCRFHAEPHLQPPWNERHVFHLPGRHPHRNCSIAPVC